MDRRIKFRHLEAFVAIQRAGSLKGAAEGLNLTQPAISKTLKELEVILGVTLMSRGRGGIGLSREGEVFVQFARQSLAALEHGLTTVAGLDEDGGAPLRVGALPSVAARLLPAAVGRFRRLSPGSPVSVEDGPHGYLVERLKGGALDLVIGRLGRPETMAGLSFSQLYTEHVVFATAADHPLANSPRLDAIADWPVIYPSRGAAIRPLVDRLMIAAGLGALENRIESVSGAFGRALTLGPDRAIWVISNGVVSDDIAAGRMAALAVDTSLTAGPVGIMAGAEEDPMPAARLFRRALIEAERDGAH